MLARQRGGQQKLAMELGQSKAWMSQLIGVKPQRPVSERTARALEAKIELPPNWLDQDHQEQPRPSVPLAAISLKEALGLVAVFATGEIVRPLAKAKFAHVCGLLYERHRQPGGVTAEYVQDLLTLAGDDGV
jgi:hypothetical protein